MDTVEHVKQLQRVLSVLGWNKWKSKLCFVLKISKTEDIQLINIENKEKAANSLIQKVETEKGCHLYLINDFVH